jgi:hypothetical protein
VNWNPDDLERIAAADELELSSRRPDGTPRPFVTMWSVVVDGELYVRSAHGPDNGWYRRALASGAGDIRSAGIKSAATFTDGSDADAAALDAEYHRKYDRYGARIVGSVVGAAAHAVTVRITPAKGTAS